MEGALGLLERLHGQKKGRAAEQLRVSPPECVVLEDAEKGVIAASLAGMRCIAIPNQRTRHHDFSKATRVCDSLNEITVELLDRLV